MWIIKPSRVHEFGRRFPQAASGLLRWLKLAEGGQWHSLVEVRKVLRSADEVKVAIGRTAVVFNIKGNDFRMITAIHYNRGKVFVMMFLTHAEYNKDTWKDNL